MFGLPLNGDDVLTNLILIVIVYVIFIGVNAKTEKRKFPFAVLLQWISLFLLTTFTVPLKAILLSLAFSFCHL